MDMKWYEHRGRQHRRSRGMSNGANLCYLNAVLQAFMHLPPFLNWVLQHDALGCKTAHCLKCGLKRLAKAYLYTAITTPIQDCQGLGDIASASFQSP